MEQEDYHYRFKVCILGARRSGKTSFASGFSSYLSPQPRRDAAADLAITSLSLQRRDLTLALSLWELAASLRAESAFLRPILGSTLVVLIVDSSAPDALSSLADFIGPLKTLHIPIALVATKLDLLDDSANNSSTHLSSLSLKAFAREQGFEYFEFYNSEPDRNDQHFERLFEILVSRVPDQLSFKALLSAGVNVGTKAFLNLGAKLAETAS